MSSRAPHTNSRDGLSITNDTREGSSHKLWLDFNWHRSKARKWKVRSRMTVPYHLDRCGGGRWWQQQAFKVLAILVALSMIRVVVLVHQTSRRHVHCQRAVIELKAGFSGPANVTKNVQRLWVSLRWERSTTCSPSHLIDYKPYIKVSN